LSSHQRVRAPGQNTHALALSRSFLDLHFHAVASALLIFFALSSALFVFRARVYIEQRGRTARTGQGEPLVITHYGMSFNPKAKFNSVGRHCRKPVYGSLIYPTWALRSYSYTDVL
jgi:hypothetical protein